MQNGFTKGLIIGSIIGASVSMMMNTDMTGSGNRRNMMRAGRNMMRRSGGFIGDLVDMLR